jgi:hypothetical protein
MAATCKGAAAAAAGVAAPAAYVAQLFRNNSNWSLL